MSETSPSYAKKAIKKLKTETINQSLIISQQKDDIQALAERLNESLLLVSWLLNEHHNGSIAAPQQDLEKYTGYAVRVDVKDRVRIYSTEKGK